jgi:hypothetical protein
MTRSDQQNKSIHVYCEELANKFNEAGLDARKVLKPDVHIPWNKEMVKRLIWKPVQDAMFDKYSTTKLSRTEVSEVYEVLNRHTAERFGISVPFPTKEEKL